MSICSVFNGDRMRNRFKITRCTIRSSKIPREIRIIQISDLHDHLYGTGQCELIGAVRSERPDLVVCTGDLFNRKRPARRENAFFLVEKLVTRYPVIIVEGNHEAVLRQKGLRFQDTLHVCGATVLMNESITLFGIHVIGLRQRPKKTDLLELIDPDHFNLVLSHRPELFPMYVSCGADLVLSGHAHGGQIRIGNFGLVAPQQGLFPKYTSGLYSDGKTRMFVSKGLGDTVLVPRINNPHELNLICLKPE